MQRPTLTSDEPLRKELESFVETVKNGTTPEVTVQDGPNALRSQ